MEYSPWGSEEDPAPISYPSTSTATSPQLSFSTTTHIPSSGGWGGDDDGGWGGATDDYTPAGFASSSSGFETVTEDLDHAVNESSSGGGGGWGMVDDAADLRISSHITEDHEGSEKEVSTIRSRPITPTPDDYRSHSPPIDSPTRTPDASASPPVEPEQEKEEEDNWGGYGTSPTLPPISSLKVEDVGTPIVARDSGWGTNDEDDWKPNDDNPPLPKMEDMFLSRPKVEKAEEEEEGWGPPVPVGSWTLGGGESSGQESSATIASPKAPEEWPSETEPEFALVKSIPASLVNDLKSESKKLASDNWNIESATWGKDGMQEQTSGVTSLLTSLLEAPSLPPPSTTQNEPPITSQTPLSSLFRLTPNLYPAFRNGLDSTALRTAETLKGTSSSAYRNARFARSTGPGRGAVGADGNRPGGDLWDLQSALGTPELISEKAHAGDEFDLDAPGSVFQQQQQQSGKSSWWGSSSQSSATSPSTNMPASLLTKKEAEKAAAVEVQPAASPRTQSPAPEPGRLGRLFGRFGKKAPSVSSPTRSSGEAERTDSWKGENLDYLDEGPIGKVAEAKQQNKQMNSDSDTFFGEGVIPSSPREEGFNGLMEGFEAAPAKAKAKSTKPKDPFDPFGDDDDEEVGGASTPAIVLAPLKSPIRINTASPSLIPARTISPAIISPNSSSSSATHPSPSASSFPTLVAPQARAVSNVAATTNSSDDFDSFFSSPPPAISPLSSTITVPLVPRSVVSPPPRSTTLSPPHRASTISPPTTSSRLTPNPPMPALGTAIPPPPRASSASPSAFAPPLPPIQPVSRGFNIAPPPPSASPLARPSPSTTPAPPAPVVPPPKPQAPTKASSGPLSFDDLSFFES